MISRARQSHCVKWGLIRPINWLIAFALFIVVECLVPSSTHGTIIGAMLIVCFAAVDLVRWREKQSTTLHGLALASTVVSYAFAITLVVSMFDFHSSRSAATSVSGFVRDLERAVSMYLGHSVAFAVFALIGITAAVRNRLTTRSGMQTVAFTLPCAILAGCLGVYHLLFEI